MWNAKILNTNYSPGLFVVTVEYSNGDKTFTEPIDMTGGSKEVLSQKIQSRLDTINATETLNLSGDIIPGPFIPIEIPEDPALTFNKAVRVVENTKRLQDLGIIDASVTSPKPVSSSPDPLSEAVQIAKDSYDPEFLTQI